MLGRGVKVPRRLSRRFLTPLTYEYLRTTATIVSSDFQSVAWIREDKKKSTVQKKEHGLKEDSMTTENVKVGSRKVDIRIKDIRKTMTEEGKKDEQRV